MDVIRVHAGKDLKKFWHYLHKMPSRKANKGISLLRPSNDINTRPTALYTEVQSGVQTGVHIKRRHLGGRGYLPIPPPPTMCQGQFDIRKHAQPHCALGPEAVKDSSST